MEHSTFTGRPIDREALREAIRHLRLPSTIRQRCANVTVSVAAGESPHFVLRREKLGEVARRVARVTRERFPGAVVPMFSRWRQLQVGGIDRRILLDSKLGAIDAAERARAHLDMITISVLLDASAGDGWRFTEPGSGGRFGQSEGLAVAVLHGFLGGAFSSDRAQPLRVDAKALEAMDSARLGRILQVGDGNPLIGLEGRSAILRRLGAALREMPEIFVGPGRPGQLLDVLSHATARLGSDGALRRVPVDRVGAAHVLRALLKAFAPVWPGNQMLGGKPVGDVWFHPHAGGDGADAQRVPLHGMAQWLAYSMVEPLMGAGLMVERLDDLTALPDYRNGGLLIDAGALVPRHPDYVRQVYTPGDRWVVEWRALTVTLMDEVARLVRGELNEPTWPLAKVREGGTWAAGREIAAELRPGGPPPVRVSGEGTLL